MMVSSNKNKSDKFLRIPASDSIHIMQSRRRLTKLVVMEWANEATVERIIIRSNCSQLTRWYFLALAPLEIKRKRTWEERFCCLRAGVYNRPSSRNYDPINCLSRAACMHFNNVCRLCAFCFFFVCFQSTGMNSECFVGPTWNNGKKGNDIDTCYKESWTWGVHRICSHERVAGIFRTPSLGWCNGVYEYGIPIGWCSAHPSRTHNETKRYQNCYESHG